MSGIAAAVAFQRPASPKDPNEEWLRCVARAINGVDYGEVTICIQAGRITQVDRTEKYREPNKKK